MLVICVGTVRPVGWDRGVWAQFSGTLPWVERVGQILGKGYLPIGGVVFQLSRVAGTDMGGRDFVPFEREMHQLVHLPHDNHVSI